MTRTKPLEKKPTLLSHTMHAGTRSRGLKKSFSANGGSISLPRSRICGVPCDYLGYKLEVENETIIAGQVGRFTWFLDSLPMVIEEYC